MFALCTLLCALLLQGCGASTSTQNPWDKYNFSPTSRTLRPVHVLAGKSLSQSGGGDTALFPVTLTGADAFVVLDFGKNVAGFTTVHFGAADGGQVLGLAYSESSDYAYCPSSPNATGSDCAGGTAQVGAGDHSNGGHGPDGYLETGSITPNTNFTPAPQHMRGGFRYLNLFMRTNGTLTITNVSVEFSAAPAMAVPSDYANHFYSSDDLLNQIWYGCAYTVQLCTVDPKQGRVWPAPASGWNNGASIGVGASILVDGAKRDRTIWPGDMGVSSDALYATTGDLVSSKNSLDTLFGYQNPQNGMLPYVGPEVFCQQPEGPLNQCPGGRGAWGSDTYHLWALVGTSNVYRYSSPVDAKAWMDSGVWTSYQAGVNCSVGKIGAKGLMVVDAKADWQRHDQGGENIAANALLAYNLECAADIATELGHPTLSKYYADARTQLVDAINKLLWDESTGAYFDNPTNTKLFPQDGNSLMVWLNVTTSDRKAKILHNLKGNWVTRGALSPEWVYAGKPAIGNFPGSMEANAHLSAGAVQDGIDLIKRQWGFQLQSPNSTRSTFWEGFQESGAFAFNGIYMSHAHGWATGPGSALTFYVLGLRPAGRTGHALLPVANSTSAPLVVPGYVVEPQPGPLAWCNGSLALHGQSSSSPRHTGRVQVAWSVTQPDTVDSSSVRQRRRRVFELVVDAGQAPNGTTGHVGVPLVVGGSAQLANDATVVFAVTERDGVPVRTMQEVSVPASAVAVAVGSDEGDTLPLPDGIVRSPRGLEDGRAWFRILQPLRVTISVDHEWNVV